MSFQAFALVVLSYCELARAQFHPFGGAQGSVNSTSGARPLRQNINVLQSDPYAWSLYIQALLAFQQQPKTDLDGYFQIAGIHGRPFVTWDNVKGLNGFTDSDSGYCTHGSILFPTWHRPYLVLFEVRINTLAQAIAETNKGPDAAIWRGAAKSLRIPYWDWASDANIPFSCSSPQITIKTSTGSRTLDNPLYTYKTGNLDPTLFPKDRADDYYYYLARDLTTTRNPPSITSSISDTQAANDNLNNQGLGIYVYNLLSQDLPYSTSATASIEGASLEEVHGNVHVATGGSWGHMTSVPYAAFDPIFWLHHTNVDRLFALWQAIYPNKWFPNPEPFLSLGTFTSPAGYPFSSDPLTPFSSQANGTAWNSDTSRHLKYFGYTYPEISDWNQTPDALKRNVTSQINALYGPSKKKHKSIVARKEHSSCEKRLLQTNTPDEKHYYVSITVNKYAIVGGFTVAVFFGPPPADTLSWKTSPNLAGSVAIFASGKVPSNAVTQGYHGEVPLGKGLTAVGLGDPNHDEVVAYLKEKLCWRIQKLDATVVGEGEVASLRVRVFYRDVLLNYDEYAFPIYGKATYLPEVTEGKVSGY